MATAVAQTRPHRTWRPDILQVLCSPRVMPPVWARGTVYVRNLAARDIDDPASLACGASQR